MQALRDGSVTGWLRRQLSWTPTGQAIVSAAIRATPAGRARRARTRSFYSQFLGPGDLCFDIGAHIGDRTSIFRALGATVVAFEPHPVTAKRLRRRFAFDPCVTVVEAAVSSESGTATIYFSSQNSRISSLTDRWQTGRFANVPWDGAVTVDTVPLDVALQRFGAPQFAKIDVEGAEVEVLSSLTAPIRYLCFEFAAEFLAEAHRCVELVERLGAYEYNLSIGESLKFLCPTWVPHMELAQVLKSAVRSDSSAWGDIYARMATP